MGHAVSPAPGNLDGSPVCLAPCVLGRVTAPTVRALHLCVGADLSDLATHCHLTPVLLGPVATRTDWAGYCASLAPELLGSPLPAHTTQGVCFVQDVGEGMKPVACHPHLHQQLLGRRLAWHLEDHRYRVLWESASLVVSLYGAYHPIHFIERGGTTTPGFSASICSLSSTSPLGCQYLS